MCPGCNHGGTWGDSGVNALHTQLGFAMKSTQQVLQSPCPHALIFGSEKGFKSGGLVVSTAVGLFACPTFMSDVRRASGGSTGMTSHRYLSVLQTPFLIECTRPARPLLSSRLSDTTLAIHH